MSNQVNGQVEKRKKISTKKILLIIVGAIASVCVLCAGFGVFYSNSQEGKATAAERSKQSTIEALVRAMAPTNTQVVLPTSTLDSAPSVEPTIVPTSTITPLPMLGLDMSQFVSKYDSLTDIQKEEFVGQSIGKWVTWTGNVSEVKSTGAVFVNLPETMLSTVCLNGIPKEIGITLSKGMTIRYTGRITSVINFLGLFINLEDVRLDQ
jgi:hypothetical protein